MTTPSLEPRQELLQRIRRVFSGGVIPPDAVLVLGETSDYVSTRAALSGKPWRELGVEFLQRNQDAIYFLSPVGLAYYLPAFMVASLEHYREADLIPDALVSALSPAFRDKAFTHADSLAAQLDREQAAAVRDFLIALSDHSGESLDSDSLQRACLYWSEVLQRAS